MSDDVRRNMALFPIGIVIKLTGLSARQIRYYEQQLLIAPARTSGNQRLFSFVDVDRLLEIRALIEKGINIAGIKVVMAPIMEEEISPIIVATKESEEKRKEMSDKELYELLHMQLALSSKLGQTSLIQGQLSRFFH